MQEEAGSFCTWACELPWQEPDAILAAWGDAPWCTFLDSGGPIETRSRWQIFCTEPTQSFWVKKGKIIWANGTVELGAPNAVFEAMRALLPPEIRNKNNMHDDLPFFGGLLGFLGYNFGAQLEGIPDVKFGDEPDCAFSFYDHAFLWDRQKKRAFVAGFTSPGEKQEATRIRQQAYCKAWGDVMQSQTLPVSSLPALQFTPDQTEKQYCHAVEQAREFIAAGDIFQVNITGRYSANIKSNFSDKQFYRALRQHAPAPFGAYMRCGGNYTLHSTSPERFLSLTAEGCITSRPIKGTAPRGKTEAEDRLFASDLACNEKECAENLMIVDLMRHDIGRVGKTGSMCVPEFLKVERFAHVHHLVSEVQGTLKPGCDVFDLLRATLPAGSVTGAPKHRALQIIAELEASSRGAYCGSLVCIGVDGRMDSAVLIRTVVRHGHTLNVGAGGGVTILSDPQKEYEEMRLKIAPLLALFGGNV